MEKSGISFVCPAYNVGPHIFEIISELYGVLQKADFPFELILIDDGSKDSTWEELQRFASGNPAACAYRNEVNSGVGFSIKKGIELAKYDYCTWVPAHGMVIPETILKNFFARNDSSIVVLDIKNMGARPGIRVALSKCYTWLINCIFLLRVPYYNTLFLVPKRKIRLSEIKSDFSFFQAEIIVLALKKWGLRLIPGEIMIRRRYDEKSHSFRLKNIWEIAKCLVDLRRRIS